MLNTNTHNIQMHTVKIWQQKTSGDPKHALLSTHGKFVDTNSWPFLITGKAFFFFPLWKTLLWSLRISSNQHSSFSMATQISGNKGRSYFATLKAQIWRWAQRSLSICKKQKREFSLQWRPETLANPPSGDSPCEVKMGCWDRDGEHTGLFREGNSKPSAAFLRICSAP